MLKSTNKIFNLFNYTILTLIGLVCFCPMWHVVCASFSDSNLLIANEGLLITPLKFTFSAYKQMFEHPLIISGTINTILIVLISSVLSLIMTAICAYILSTKGPYWNKLFGIMVVITMYFSGGLVPGYLLVAKWLNLNNSHLALILPGMISVYNMMIMRTSFEGIPESLRESAELDGAGHIRILFSIILPLSKAMLAVILLYYAVAQWNSWFSASIFLRDRSKYPLQLVLREILIENDTALMNGAETADQAAVGESIKYSTMVYGTLPILLVYPFLQKYFTKGIMIGAVKG